MASFSSICIITTFLSLSIYKTMGWEWKYPRVSSEKTGLFVGTAPACSATSNSCPSDYSYPWYSVTSGTGRYCSSGRKHYCHNHAMPYSSIRWAGTGPWCSGDCSDCTGGESCLAVDGSGDGNTCNFGEKALCVRYRSRRRMRNENGLFDFNEYEQDEQDEQYETEYIPNGIETGFYLYFGDEFDNNLLLNDQELLNEFILAVGMTLKELIPDGEVDYNDGKISGSGYIDNNNMQRVGIQFQAIFKDAKLVPFINIKYDSHSIDTMAVKSYLRDDVNTEIINKAIEDKLLNGQTVFKDLECNVKVLLVDANCY